MKNKNSKKDKEIFTVSNTTSLPFPIKKTLAFAKRNKIRLLEKDLIFANEVMTLIITLTNLSVSELCSVIRTDHLVQYRALFWYMVATRSRMGLKANGMLTGSKHHSTVINGIQQIEKYLRNQKRGGVGAAYRVFFSKVRNAFGHLPVMDHDSDVLRPIIALEQKLFGKPKTNSLGKIFKMPIPAVKSVFQDYFVFAKMRVGEKARHERMLERYLSRGSLQVRT